MRYIDPFYAKANNIDCEKFFKRMTDKVEEKYPELKEDKRIEDIVQLFFLWTYDQGFLDGKRIAEEGGN